MKEMRVECPALSSDFADRKGQFQVENGCGSMAPATSGIGIPDGTQNDRRVPLKTILQNFLNHVESLETRKKEGEDAYEKEFQSLKLFSDQLKSQADFSSSEGEKDVNRKKNRYKDILPFDYTRVALSEYPGVPGSDYINASFIKGASGSNAYIGCQGPLPHTVNDFWRMVVECEVQVIVMACNEQEAGKHKCEKYWRDGNDELSADETEHTSNQPTATFGKYEVTLLKSREICPDFLVRTMRLRWKNEGSHSNDDKQKSINRNAENTTDASSTSSQSNAQGQLHRNEYDDAVDEANSSEESTSGEFDEERTVCQFHYSAWPDHGIPLQVKPLLEMVRLIRDCQASETLPVLIHCSAGCGRTGTICAIDFIWGLLRTGKLSEDFSLYSLVREMRKQRIAMVQTVDQYILVHRAVKELFLEQLKVIDAHPYENVDDDGHPISIYRSSDCNEPIVPDYETIFVKGNEHKIASSASSTTSNSNLSTAVDFDRILNQKMIQSQLQRQQQNDAYNSSELTTYDQIGHNSEDIPPNPPPKQRNVLDPKAIDSRNVTLPDSLPSLDDTVAFPKQELVLFEPPATPSTTDNNQKFFSSRTGPALGRCHSQKIKKGNLRLAQTEDGAWKLEGLETALPDMNNDASKYSQSQSVSSDHVKKDTKKNETFVMNRKGKNKKDKKASPKREVDDGDSPKAGELLRKPSIKKIRAFFNKDKQQLTPETAQNSSPSTSSSSSSSTCLDQGTIPTEELNNLQNDNGDHDIAMAISKLPKLEEHRHPTHLQETKLSTNLSNSKSVPSSLDRRVCNNSSDAGLSTDEIINCTERPLVVLRAQSNERIPSGADISTITSTPSYNSFGNTFITSNNERPLLPVKRSKSMRAGSMSPPSTNMMPIATTSGTNTSTIDTLDTATTRYNSGAITNRTFQDPEEAYNHSTNHQEQNSKTNKNKNVQVMSSANDYCDKLNSNNAASGKNKHYFGLPLKEKSKNDIMEQNTSTSIRDIGLNDTGGPSPPPKPKRWNNSSSSPGYANVSNVRCDNNSQGICSYEDSSNEASKSYSMTDFSQLKKQLIEISDSVENGGNEDTNASNEDSLFLENHLMKLHARKELSGHTTTEMEDSKSSLRDCQEYLMASFDMAEKEGERLMTTSVNGENRGKNFALGLLSPTRLPTALARTNRSAESSPITTMQKKSVLQQREQLFSSHSSPSSSYNKYNVFNTPTSNTTSIDKSPPLRMIKSGSNSSFLGYKKNYLNQSTANTFEKTDTRDLSKNTAILKSQGNTEIAGRPLTKGDDRNNQYENMKISTSAISSESSYSVVAMEAQRKVSAAVVAGGPKARERRNSFREAVKSGANTENKKGSSPGKTKFPKKPYESIWFGKGGEGLEDHPGNDERIEKEETNVISDVKNNLDSNPMDSTTRPPIYVNTVIPSSKLRETNHRHYDNVSFASSNSNKTVQHSALASSGGYEPVTFKDGKAIQTRKRSMEENRSIQSNGRITPPGGLQCVSLVNEIMNTNRSLNSGASKQNNTSTSTLSPALHDRELYQSQNEASFNKGALRKQNSNGSVVSNGSGNSGMGNKGPPPPYKQPPKVTMSTSSTQQYISAPSLNVKQYHSTLNQVQPPPYQNIHTASQLSPQLLHSSQSFHTSQAGTGLTSKSGTYANLPFFGQNQAEAHINTTKDDLALMHEPLHYRNPSSTSYDTNLSNVRGFRPPNKNRIADRNRANKTNPNRYSCGDFSSVLNRSNQLTGLENILNLGQGDVIPSSAVQSSNAKHPFQYRLPDEDVTQIDQISNTNTRCSINQSPNAVSALEDRNINNVPQENLHPNKSSENTRQVPPALKHPSSSTGDLLPGIDLDTVALMMQGGKEHLSTSMSSLGGFSGGKGGPENENRVKVGRTIAGVFSGAAANIRSRFSNLSTVNTVFQGPSPIPETTSDSMASNSNQSWINHEQGDYHEASKSTSTRLSNNELFSNPTAQYSQQQYYPQTNNRWSEVATTGQFTHNKSVEQLSPNALPITVPGADITCTLPYNGIPTPISTCTTIPTSVHKLSFEGSQSPSNAYGYPQRPLLRPQGPRDPPSHFQRKQEYF